MARDMTKGRILPQMTAFAIPLILGNLFQILYNATDSIIVGKFVGDDALAAVGTAGPIMNMAIQQDLFRDTARWYHKPYFGKHIP